MNSCFKLAAPVIRMAPSLLAADFSRLREEVAVIESGGADLLHLDVMDGLFVPNISFGPAIIASLRPHSRLFFDTHLMIQDPKRYAEAFVAAGSDLITFHVEVTESPREVIEHIRLLGASVGVSINPDTPVSAIEPIVRYVDLVLVMSVWPGFGGQTFIHDVLPKVQQIRALLDPHQRLEIDGGIDAQTIGLATQAGADTLVAGSAIFGQDDPVAEMTDLRRLAELSAVGATDEVR